MYTVSILFIREMPSSSEEWGREGGREWGSEGRRMGLLGLITFVIAGGNNAQVCVRSLFYVVKHSCIFTNVATESLFWGGKIVEWGERGWGGKLNSYLVSQCVIIGGALPDDRRHLSSIPQHIRENSYPRWWLMVDNSCVLSSTGAEHQHWNLQIIL